MFSWFSIEHMPLLVKEAGGRFGSKRGGLMMSDPIHSFMSVIARHICARSTVS